MKHTCYHCKQDKHEDEGGFHALIEPGKYGASLAVHWICLDCRKGYRTVDLLEEV